MTKRKKIHKEAINNLNLCLKLSNKKNYKLENIKILPFK